jgi:hypothetical protein
MKLSRERIKKGDQFYLSDAGCQAMADGFGLIFIASTVVIFVFAIAFSLFNV